MIAKNVTTLFVFHVPVVRVGDPSKRNSHDLQILRRWLYQTVSQGRLQHARKKPSTNRHHLESHNSLPAAYNPGKWGKEWINKESLEREHAQRDFPNLVHVATVFVKKANGMPTRHESLFDITQLQSIQIQHVLLIFLLPSTRNEMLKFDTTKEIDQTGNTSSSLYHDRVSELKTNQ